MRLAGVAITVSDLTGSRRPATTESGKDGRFEVPGLAAGRYQIAARLTGFSDATGLVTLTDDQDLEVDLDLELAPVTEEVRVVGQAGLAQTETSVSRESVKGQMIEFLPVVGDDYRALLPVVPGVVRTADGRISLKGARETQDALQVGRAYANDPSTGVFGFELPADSIDSVEVLANPYAAEDGRFSSTTVRIETRAGGDRWHALANGFAPLPCLKVCDGASMGIQSFRPRGWVGGPLRKERLFIAQGVQFRYAMVRVPGLPEGANRTRDRGMEAFTRLDSNLAGRHALTATFAAFPRRAESINLNTFTPVEASPGIRFTGYRAGVSDTATVSSSLLVESALTATAYHTRLFGQGDGPAELTVDGLRGNYFNTQTRRTHVWQWTESITRAFAGASGDHMARAGIDVMWASYAGTSASRPVLVRRADGTVSQRLDFGAPASQRADGIDAAAFVQDRWRPNERLLFEPGLRVERDGVTGRANISPRVGFVLGLGPGGTAVLRGGVGRFFERTPLNIAAFGQFETATLTRFAPDGITPVSPPVEFVHRGGRLLTPSSLVWNLEYDHRFGSNLFLKLSHLRRRSRGIAVVEPWQSGGEAELRLDSTGRGRYVETEVSLRYGASEFRQLAVSYVRSRSDTHLNVFDTFFGGIRQPIVRPDQYARSPTDVPNRVLIRGIVTLLNRWTMSSLVEVRDGFPYSLVNEDQEYVGARNAGGRFPRFVTVDVSLIRSLTVLGRPVRFGLRGHHLLNSFSPRDVQNNIDSPALGAFYNTIPRKILLVFTFLSR